MAKKTCPNGHIYDPNIYGDQCPLCPASVSAPIGSGPETHLGVPPTPPPMPGGGGFSGGAPAGGMHTHIAGGGPQGPRPNMNDASGATSVRPKEAEPKGGPAAGGGHTVIRHAGKPAAGGRQASRKLVGFLVTYNREPNGRAYKIYEGRNFLGRDASCDISITDDDQISSKHMSILFRNVDKKFKFRDEQSSNGTFVNNELVDDGELQNYDIIRTGNTLFVFVAIPDVF